MIPPDHERIIDAEAPVALEPDRDQIEVFLQALFRHAAAPGFVSLRAFHEGGKAKFRISPSSLAGGLAIVVDQAEDDARRAAQAPKPVVFSAPIATFRNERAREQDVAQGLALTVECDQHPQEAREKLERILGAATVVVASGGKWTNGSGGAEDKLHLHWRLAEPVIDRENLRKLKQARDAAARLVGADPSGKSVVHPFRVPGSWHRKAEPILCRIAALDADREIDLDAALAALTAAAPAEQPSNGKEWTGSGSAKELTEMIYGIVSGKSYHANIIRLSAKLAAHGLDEEAEVTLLRALMENTQGARDERWQNRFDSIPADVGSAHAKYGRQTAGALRSARASRYNMRAVEWIWKNRIAKGALNVLAGLPDKGKGLMWADAVARITRGDAWPAKEGRAPQGNVIILTAEDDIARTVIPRLVAAGADLDRVEIVEMARNADGSERMFSLVTDLPLLRAKIEEVGDVVAVIIDPMSAYLGVGKVAGGSTTDVRGVLAPLTKLAEEKQVAVLAVMHFNKKADITNAILRIADSLAYAAAPRSVYMAIEDLENENAYLLIKVKNNLAPANVPALRYMIGGPREVGFDEKLGKPIEAPFLLWDNNPVKITAVEAMEAAIGAGRSKAKDDAADFLRSKLALGPVLSDDVYAEANARGIAAATLRRAKRELRIISEREHGKIDGKWCWRLPRAEDEGRR